MSDDFSDFGFTPGTPDDRDRNTLLPIGKYVGRTVAFQAEVTRTSNNRRLQFRLVALRNFETADVVDGRVSHAITLTPAARAFVVETVRAHHPKGIASLNLHDDDSCKNAFLGRVVAFTVRHKPSATGRLFAEVDVMSPAPEAAVVDCGGHEDPQKYWAEVCFRSRNQGGGHGGGGGDDWFGGSGGGGGGGWGDAGSGWQPTGSRPAAAGGPPGSDDIPF